MDRFDTPTDQMVVIIFSTLIYFAERGTWDPSLLTFVDADGDPSNFGSSNPLDTLCANLESALSHHPAYTLCWSGTLLLVWATGSIPACAWLVLVTITTVGYAFSFSLFLFTLFFPVVTEPFSLMNSYGDIVPKSTLGRLVCVPLLCFGLLLVALPSFVLGRNFATVWDALRNVADEVRWSSFHQMS